MSDPLASAATGYITLAKYITGKTPQQIEKDLGLPEGYLNSGARIYSFTRLPLSHEYEYELTAKYPDGLHFNSVHGDQRYLPGSDKIHQWRVRRDAKIPIDQGNTIAVGPGQMVQL
jgi:hypothetical protein